MKAKAYMKKTALTFLLALSLFASETGRCMAAEQGSTGKQENSAAKTGAAETETAVQETEVADSIEISNVQELESFAQECRNDWYSYGKVFSLTADIDLTGTDFQGIPYFNGTLKGNGHTISGFSLSRKGSDYGFFRYLGKNAVVEELTVEGTVRMDGSAENVGGLAGMNFGMLSGCSFHGTVSASKSVGGVVGYNKADGKVVGCSASGTVTATNGTGGICGENKGLLKDCVSECVVNGEDLKPTLDLDGVDLGSLNLTQNVVTRNDSGGIAGITSGTVTAVSYTHLPCILAAYCGAGQSTGNGDKQLGNQRMDVFFPEVRRGKVFLLEISDQGINLHIVGRIKYGICRDAETEAGIDVGRKVQIAVAETFYSLIMLGRLQGVKNTCIFLGDMQLILQIYLHWSFQEKKKVIAAA